MIIKSGKRREMYGQVWEWHENDGRIRSHWKGIVDGRPNGNTVMIFPPTKLDAHWYIDVCDEEVVPILGDDAEERAFAAGKGFITQDRSRART